MDEMNLNNSNLNNPNYTNSNMSTNNINYVNPNVNNTNYANLNINTGNINPNLMGKNSRKNKKKSSALGITFAILSIIMGIISALGSILIIIYDATLPLIIGFVFYKDMFPIMCTVAILSLITIILGIVGRKSGAALGVGITGIVIGSFSLIVSLANVFFFLFLTYA